MEPQNLKSVRVRIGLLPTAELRLRDGIDVAGKFDGAHPLPSDDESNYWADAIQDGSRFYYRVDGITVEIDEDEYGQVIGNPSLYYFSTALKLHFKIKRAKEQA